MGGGGSTRRPGGDGPAAPPPPVSRAAAPPWEVCTPTVARGRRWGGRGTRPGGRRRGLGVFGGGGADPSARLAAPWLCCLGAACRPQPRAGRRGGGEWGITKPQPLHPLCSPSLPLLLHPLCTPPALLHPAQTAAPISSPPCPPAPPTSSSYSPLPPLPPCTPSLQHPAPAFPHPLASPTPPSTRLSTLCQSRCPPGSGFPPLERHPQERPSSWHCQVSSGQG